MTPARAMGQSMIFEQALLFGMGVTIFIVCYAVFNIYEDHFSHIALIDQLDEIRGWVGANTVKFVGKNPDGDGWISFAIPKRAGGQPYYITFSGNGVNITAKLTGDYSWSPVFGLNDTYTMSGMANSNTGKCLIYKTGDKLIIQ
jgi:hypothetical protein